MSKTFQFTSRLSLILGTSIALILLFFPLVMWQFLSYSPVVDFDQSVLLWFRNPNHLEQLKLFGSSVVLIQKFSYLGKPEFLCILSAVICFYLFFIGKVRDIIYVCCSVYGATLLLYIAKEFFLRPRPNIVTQMDTFQFHSFPSSHACLSLIVYTLLTRAVIKRIPSSLPKLGLSCATFILILGIGLSRVALGVHWPTDIIAGWMLGIGWMALCRIVLNKA